MILRSETDLAVDRSWKAVIEISVSIVSWSLDSRDITRPARSSATARLKLLCIRLPIGVVSKNAIAECRTAQSDALNIRRPADRLVTLPDSQCILLIHTHYSYLIWKLNAKEKTAMATPSAAYVPM